MSAGFKVSFWEHETFAAPTDVAIIGGGIVGLNAAIALKKMQPKLDVSILERGTYPIGASTRNAGFACFGSISEIVADIENAGKTAALELFHRRRKGLEYLLTLVPVEEIGYEHLGGYEVFMENDGERFEQCADQITALNRELGAEAFKIADDAIAAFDLRNVKHVISHPLEGQLHPGKLTKALQDVAIQHGVRMLFGFDVSDVREEERSVRIQSPSDISLMAKHVLMTNNGFVHRLVDSLDIVPARNQVLVTKPLPGLKLKGCFHYNEGYVYFRNVGQRILIGGARNIAAERETTDEFGLTEDIAEWLNDFLVRHITGSRAGIGFAWSGILGVGPSKAPIVKSVGTRKSVAVRLGGMGVAIGSLVGLEAAEHVLETL